MAKEKTEKAKDKDLEKKLAPEEIKEVIENTPVHPEEDIERFHKNRLSQIRLLIGIAKTSKGGMRNILYYSNWDSVYFRWEIISQFADFKKISIEVEAPLNAIHRTDQYGKYDEYQCVVKATNIEGRTVKAIGFETTRSPFFMVDAKTNTILEYEEIPSSRVQKAAITKGYNQAVQELCAIKSITLDDMEKCGIQIMDMNVIETPMDYGNFMERLKEDKNKRDEKIRKMIEKKAPAAIEKEQTVPPEQKKPAENRPQKEKKLSDTLRAMFHSNAKAAREDVIKVLNRKIKIDPQKGIMPNLSDRDLDVLLLHYSKTSK